MEERDALILEGITRGDARLDICHRTGIEPSYLILICRKKGWVLPKTTRLTVDQRDRKMPYGLDPKSARMRGRLGGIVSDLLDRKVNPVELAMITGVTQTQLSMTKARPFNHDWSMSQLQRLAAYLGKDFNVFMQELIQP